MAAIPHCAKKIGSMSVVEPEGDVHGWTQQQLPSPTKLIKVFVAKSACFTLVDRGMGMNAAMRERELASGGQLRGGSNMGKGQIKAADDVVVPDMTASNKEAGGLGLGGRTVADGWPPSATIAPCVGPGVAARLRRPLPSRRISS
ncbi:hypothetical protein [Luteibacter sp. CQ10]|uniref:hypothetical protein n=1 Tax=Luteibacter sp. CQ10 TaxID=2805821 RepID=UPI0034A2ACE6